MPQIPEQAMIAFWTIIMSAGACVLSFVFVLLVLLMFSVIVDRLIINPEAERKSRENDNY